MRGSHSEGRQRGDCDCYLASHVYISVVVFFYSSFCYFDLTKSGATSMSALTRLFYRTPTTRRSYSSFFSSKSGGGRYFNSAKPPKSAVVTAKSKSDHSSSDRSTKDSSATSSSTSASAASGSDASSTHTPRASADPASPESGHDATAQALGSGSASYSQGYPPNHPYLVVNSKDFKMHQFFSLHRPLLLLSNPASLFVSAPVDVPLFHSSSLSSEAGDKLPVAPFTSVNLDGTFPSAHAGAGVDGDAEAARQLHHAMTMSKVGAVASWEEALKRIGLDVSKEAERVGLREQWDREWEEVMLDSVKRKRKKKMKKHKLKKLRRATRAQRMRMGR